MPEWKFLVARHFGGTQQRRMVCANIKQIVEQHGLATVLPLVKYELGRGHEYYLGIAVDAYDPDTIDRARQVLREAGIATATNPQLSPLVEAEQVTGLLKGNLECDSFTLPMTYERDIEVEPVRPEQVLPLKDIYELQPLDSDMLDSSRMDRLLYWCSATGAGDLGRIQQTCQLLRISIEWGGAWSVIRRLVLLGHLEFEMRNTIRWGIVPPVLVTPAVDNGCCFLVGQRCSALVQTLNDQFPVVEIAQPEGPRQLLVHGVDEDAVITLRQGRHITNLGRVSLRLGKLLPTIDQWVERLPVWDEKDFGRYLIERYDPESDDFCAVATFTQPRKGLYRFNLEQAHRQFSTLAFYDDKSCRWVCGDFYGLRFLARHHMGTCRVVYRSEARELLMPLTDRWPMPYERALVLASGMLPRRLRAESGLLVLAYSGITSELATKLCDLLGLYMQGE